MPVAHHNLTNEFVASTTSFTRQHVVHASANFLVVTLAINMTTTASLAVTVTVNGSVVPVHREQRGGGDFGRCYVYGVPVAGGTTATVSVTLSQSLSVVLGTLCLSGVDTATPFGATASANASTSTASVSPAPLSNPSAPQYVLDVACRFTQTSGGGPSPR